MGNSTNTRTITIKFAGSTKDLVKAAADADIALKTVGKSADTNSGGLDKFVKSTKDFGESVSKLAGPARIVAGLTSAISLVNKAVPAILQTTGALGLIPGALASIEIARKVFSLGLDSLKKQLAGVSKQLQADVQPVFEKAFKPASSWVQKLIPDIKNVAVAEAGVVTQTLKMLSTQDSLTRVHSIFGSTSTVVQNLGAAFTPLLHALLTFTDVSASAFARLTSTAGDWATKLDKWVTKVANNGSLYNWIENGISKLEELTDKGVNAFNKIFNALRPLATVRVTIFETLGQLLIPVLTWLGNFIAAHPSLGNWIVGVALAFQILGPAIRLVAIAIDFFSGGPIGLIIVAIAALVAGFIYLWNTSSGFRLFWINLWHDIQNVVSVLVTWWTTVAAPFFGRLFAPIIGAFNAFLDFWHAAWNAGLGDWIKVQLTILETIFKVAWDIISAVFVAAWDIIWGIIRGAWTIIVGIIQGGFTIIKGIFEIFTGILTGNWGKVWQGIKDVLGGAWTFIVSVVKGIGDVFGGLGDAVGRIFGGIGRAIGDAINGAMAVLRGIIGVIKDVIDWFGRLFGAASHAQDAATAAANAGSSGAQNKARASGGSAFRNRPYLVGENGPELFSPGRTGMVTSTDDTAALGSGGPIVIKIGNETIAEITQAQISAANKGTVRAVRAGVQTVRR